MHNKVDICQQTKLSPAHSPGQTSLVQISRQLITNPEAPFLGSSDNENNQQFVNSFLCCKITNILTVSVFPQTATHPRATRRGTWREGRLLLARSGGHYDHRNTNSKNKLPLPPDKGRKALPAGETLIIGVWLCGNVNNLVMNETGCHHHPVQPSDASGLMKAGHLSPH